MAPKKAVSKSSTAKTTSKTTSKANSSIKYYVLDTNVILHDWRSFLNFEENYVIIPIVVISEVDHFKSGFELINYNAREFSRELDSLVGNKPLSEWCDLKNGGHLKVITKLEKTKDYLEAFPEDIPDHRIIATVLTAAKEYGKDKVVLVSKDINIRLKAKSIGLQAEDYSTDKVPTMDKQYSGVTIIEGFSQEIINELYMQEFIELHEIIEKYNPFPNEYFVFKSDQQSGIARYIKKDNNFRLVKSHTVFGVQARNVEQTCAIDALLDPEITLVTLQGIAGSGKTLCAIASALECKKLYKQILITKPVVSLASEQLGFLPGDMDEKLSPIFQSYFDNIDVIKHNLGEGSKQYTNLQEVISSEKIKMMAMSFLRGRTLPRNYIISDESQNNSTLNIRTLLTRVGEGSKIILMGDVSQIDSPYLDEQSNGLAYVIEKFKGQECYAHITFTKGERSALAELACKLL